MDRGVATVIGTIFAGLLKALAPILLGLAFFVGFVYLVKYIIHRLFDHK